MAIAPEVGRPFTGSKIVEQDDGGGGFFSKIPIWVWIAIGLVIVYALYTKSQSQSGPLVTMPSGGNPGGNIIGYDANGNPIFGVPGGGSAGTGGSGNPPCTPGGPTGFMCGGPPMNGKPCPPGTFGFGEPYCSSTKPAASSSAPGTNAPVHASYTMFQGAKGAGTMPSAATNGYIRRRVSA
jgi:hypothetical protein